MNLTNQIATMKGIGPKKQTALNRLGIYTIEDFLFYYPRDYEDRRELRTIRSLIDGEIAMVRGKLIQIEAAKVRFPKKRTVKALIEDGTGTIEAIFFRAGYLEKTLKTDQIYVCYGKVSIKAGKKQMIHPDIHPYSFEQEKAILPIYPLTSGVTQTEMRKWQKEAMAFLSELKEYLPDRMIARNRLCGLHYALTNIHFPLDRQQLMESKYRLIFDELLFLQTGLLRIKKKMVSKGSAIIFSKDVAMDLYTKTLPYPLTHAQRRVLAEINRDMESSIVMNRLVQGDVGSGKTVVAAAALFKAVKSGYQAVLMAPTELLARQHYEGLKTQFFQHGIETGFLSGSLTAKEKREVLSKIQDGSVQVVIGTHAVIQPNVVFSNLGLVITDEQHRFGVNQRAVLSKKGNNPDILVMTATPIPRTLAVILYGDLDISIIDEMPPGRQEIITRTVKAEGRTASYEFVRREVAKGRQAYVVAPLIEDSENLDARSALGLYEELKDQFCEFQVAFLHGAMKQPEKDRIMEEFYHGEIQILISTVVIEVGINVPNATIMMIENAERFGLAQLHQLRGRVGRGEEQSYCVLITDGNSAVAKQRAEIMKSTNDGFVIAEKDLELRGPGEFFGTRQHGLPELKLADLVKHIKILQVVKEEAENVLKNDFLMEQPEHIELSYQIDRIFRHVTALNL